MKRLLLALLVAAPLSAQRVTGVGPGTDTVSASVLLNIQGVQTRITAMSQIVVVFGQPLRVELWKGVRLMNGIKVGIPLDQLEVGETGCTLTTVTDSRGNQIAGIQIIGYVSSNPAIVSITSGTGVSGCPTTSVRIADLPVTP